MIQLGAASPLPVPSPPFEVEESLTSSVDYGFIDIVDASICDSESRAMTAVGEDRSTALEASIMTLEAQVRTLQT
uniref:Uncharacterized protein n=1 Tax=Tanacetum cinerariifolium TaxID=118510 RepID=A0A699JXZ9_TANCI|nr:hypothetical protein [Tanacetum cinerariifolium]